MGSRYDCSLGLLTKKFVSLVITSLLPLCLILCCLSSTHSHLFPPHRTQPPLHVPPISHLSPLTPAPAPAPFPCLSGAASSEWYSRPQQCRWAARRAEAVFICFVFCILDLHSAAGQLDVQKLSSFVWQSVCSYYDYGYFYYCVYCFPYYYWGRLGAEAVCVYLKVRVSAPHVLSFFLLHLFRSCFFLLCLNSPAPSASQGLGGGLEGGTRDGEE